MKKMSKPRSPRKAKQHCVCKVCGKEFLSKSSKSIYCSKPCQYKQKRLNDVIAIGTTKECAWCGRTFQPKNATTKTCSKECKSNYISMGRMNVDQNRPFTPDTVYYVKTWYKNGDSVNRIAMALGRPISVIEAIVRGEYDEFERESIKNVPVERETETDFDVQEWA